ncbi:MAG: Tim44 domain-containing protein [Betaproteobacteria bacterium]|nr:Tim44 domain-containing protein [Betaproteobacteria bacterium]
MSIPDSEAARRLGGGKSFGAQRQATPQQPRPEKAPQAAPQQQPGAAGAAGGSRWFGPVAGLLAGGLLGAMIFGGAFEGIKLMDVLLIALLAFGLFYLFKMMRKPQHPDRRREPLQYAGVGAEPRIDPAPRDEPVSAGAAAAPAARYFPAGFDAEGFAQQAKRNFIRLQEANDRADLAALRDMMTPHLYPEIEAQIRERGGEAQKTDVVTLDAKVIEVVTEGDHFIASVRFTGLMKDEPGAQPESFSEVWHLQKPLSGSSGWLMAGIQQD